MGFSSYPRPFLSSKGRGLIEVGCRDEPEGRRLVRRRTSLSEHIGGFHAAALGDHPSVVERFSG